MVQRPRWIWLGLALTVLVTAPLANAAAEDRPVPQNRDELPPRYRTKPFRKVSLSVGYPNAGWQRRGLRLKKRKYLRVKSAGARRNYGHPALVKMLRRTARDIARAIPGSVMLVGDLSKERGGVISGHRSHQSGRDADVGFYARDRAGKLVQLRRFVAFDAHGLAKDGSGMRFDDARNWMLLRGLLMDRRASIQHVFISRPLRARLLAYARRNNAPDKYVKAAEVLLKQPHKALPHDDHFHIRIGCPRGQSDICRPSTKR